MTDGDEPACEVSRADAAQATTALVARFGPFHARSQCAPLSLRSRSRVTLSQYRLYSITLTHPIATFHTT